MRVQNWRLGGNLPGYTFMQNLGLKVKIPSNQVYVGSNFDNLYFHEKSQGKSNKYDKIKSDKPLKRYNHAEFKSDAWKQIQQLIFSRKILG